MNVFTRGIRNAFRNVIRTISIIVILGLSVGLALAMLIANQAVGQKIESIESSVGNTVSVSPAGLRGFEGGGDALKEEDIDKLKDLDHVTGTVETLSDRLTSDNSDLESATDAGDLGERFSSNSGQTFVPQGGMSGGGESGGENFSVSFTPPVTVNGTTDPTDLSSDTQGGGSFTLKSGEVFEGDSTEHVALVGTDLAEKNGLSVGDTFKAYDTDIKVVGIFDSGNSFSNNQVIMPLAAVQELTDQADSISGATLKVDSVANVDSVTEAASDAMGDKADVVNEAESAQESIEPLKNIQTISMYSLFGAVAAGAVIILLTMIMIVRERRREIGVIKAIGASNLKVMFQFMVEATTLTLMGAVIGIALGVIAGNPITKLLVNNSTDTSMPTPGRGAIGSIGNGVSNISATVGWDIILYGLGAAIVIGVVGSALASFFIAKIRPSEVMRAE